MKKVDVRPEDVVVVISNSGRNPLPLEIAMGCKKKRSENHCSNSPGSFQSPYEQAQQRSEAVRSSRCGSG